jgi:hypothetical protein
MGPQGTLPAALARLNPRYRVALKNAATRLIGFEASGPVGGFDADGRLVRQPEI